MEGTIKRLQADIPNLEKIAKKAESLYTEQKSKGDKAATGNLDGDVKEMGELEGKVAAKQKAFFAKKAAWEDLEDIFNKADDGAKEQVMVRLQKAKEEMADEEMGLKDF